jgi:Lrp/AsnC family transcriptional regulator for asnA, asnC and gidA
MEVDGLDRKLLNTLLEDGRQSLRRLAKKVGVSVVTAMKRVKRLEKEGVITGYEASLDYDFLGYDVPVTIRIQIAKGKLIEVQKRIAAHGNVIACYDVTGDFDALVLARFKNRRALDTFLKKIQGYDFVIRTQTNLILNVVKEKKLRVG